MKSIEISTLPGEICAFDSSGGAGASKPGNLDPLPQTRAAFFFFFLFLQLDTDFLSLSLFPKEYKICNPFFRLHIVPALRPFRSALQFQLPRSAL
jgi:hypothetical protein